LCQPARGFGYRANADAILLAAFALQREGRAPRTVVDLGAGVGTVTLALAHLGSFDRAVLIERRTELAKLAERNLADNGCAGRARVLCTELDEDSEIEAFDEAQGTDLVVANPPFVAPERDGAAEVSADPRLDARRGSALPFVRAAA